MWLAREWKTIFERRDLQLFRFSNYFITLKCVKILVTIQLQYFLCHLPVKLDNTCCLLAATTVYLTQRKSWFGKIRGDFWASCSMWELHTLPVDYRVCCKIALLCPCDLSLKYSFNMPSMCFGVHKTERTVCPSASGFRTKCVFVLTIMSELSQRSVPEEQTHTRTRTHMQIMISVSVCAPWSSSSAPLDCESKKKPNRSTSGISCFFLSTLCSLDGNLSSS